MTAKQPQRLHTPDDVREGIDSISLNSDVAVATTMRIAAAESK